jgi:two-component system, NtrC family, response regulator AtoC
MSEPCRPDRAFGDDGYDLPGATNPSEELRRAGMKAVSIAFGSLGRTCMTLDADFRIRNVSAGLETLLGAGTIEHLVGQPAEKLFGEELLGVTGNLRAALLAGERREGWRASLRMEPSGSRQVSVSAAPLVHDSSGTCDPESSYLIVVRPVEDELIEEGGSDGLTGFGGLIAASPAMLRILRLVESLQHSEATVLIGGESGTGKEVLARAIHAHSPRRDGPFVVVNCAAIPAELLESELFGHVRGAFTGAVRDRVGPFELADHGTLFLDEIGEMPPSLQAKLLRVLQDGTYERVGEGVMRRTHARIIAATNIELRQAVEVGRFRKDLFYRLRVVPIELPPLRERREDVEPLARHLLARVNARSGRAVRLTPGAMRALLGYDWPGNVRELQNGLEYAVAVSTGQSLQPEDLPVEVTAGSRRSPASAALAQGPARTEVVPQAERARLLEVLDRHQWNRAAAAAALGMSRSTLWRRMRELSLVKRVATFR